MCIYGLFIFCLFYAYGCLLALMSVYHVHSVSVEARRLLDCCELSYEPREFNSGPLGNSQYFNPCAISPVPQAVLFVCLFVLSVWVRQNCNLNQEGVQNSKYMDKGSGLGFYSNSGIDL